MWTGGVDEQNFMGRARGGGGQGGEFEICHQEDFHYQLYVLKNSRGINFWRSNIQGKRFFAEF